MGKMKWPFLCFLICEVAYMVAVRVLVYSCAGSPNLHADWLAIRMISLVVLISLFRRHDADGISKSSKVTRSSVLGAAIFAVPIAVGNLAFPTADRFLIAVGGIVAGVREEIAYRGILQRTLIGKLGYPSGLLVTTIVFVVYHFGIQPFTAVNVLDLFFVGLVFGIIYYSTGSIVFVAILHAAYNGLWAISPFTAQPLSQVAGAIIACVAATIVVVASKWPNKPPATTAAVTPPAQEPRQP
jgi:membrane protease YdiL (CAAX protease family)